MINEIDKATMYVVASQTLVKSKNLWFYDMYKENVLNAIDKERVVSYYSVNGSYRRCGKSTMLIKMHEELENSVIIVGNASNQRNLKCSLRKRNIKENPNVILVENKKEPTLEYVYPIRGLKPGTILLIDDSLCENSIAIIRKHYPQYSLFGFVFKQAVSLI